MSEPERLEINWINAAGGALGAVSAAVVLSTLGTAGTLLGAAIGSLCITVGGAIYSHSLRVTRRRVAAARALAARRERSRSGSDTTVAAGEAGTQATEVLEREAAAEPWSQTLRGLPWKRIGLVSAALFVITVVAIMIFELSIGRPVSSLTGGTDSESGTLVPGVGRGGDGGSGGGPGEQEAPDPRVELPEEGVPEPPAQEEQPDEEPAPLEGSPTAEPTPTPVAPTAQPTPTQSPS